MRAAALSIIGMAVAIFLGDVACAVAQEMPAKRDVDLAFARGAISGKAQVCGLDWQGKNFRPMMAYFRHTRGLSEQQNAVLAAMHGAAQGQNSKGGCSPQRRREAQAQLTFKP
jgi:hypothetical protein